MPNISNLFYSSDIEKRTLHKNIVPLQEQQEIQQERWHDVDEYLKDRLSEMSGYTISSWIQGSYKFGTQIRPVHITDEFDIDLGMYFNWKGEPDDSEYTPLELKSMPQNCLYDYAKEAADEAVEVIDPPKTRCSRIRFKGNFHIDIPSYHIDPDLDKRSLATEENKWENSDPKALYLWFREKCSEEDSNLIRRLVRYLKVWAALNFEEKKEPSTIVLTVLIVEAFLQLNEEQIIGDDIAFGNCVQKIIERVSNDSEVLNPVDRTENLNRLDVSACSDFIDKLINLLDVSNRAIKAQSELEAATIWQEVFAHFFPLPILNNSQINKNALTTVSFIPQVQIKAFLMDDPNKVIAVGENSISNVPKNCNIEFKIVNASLLPWDAQIQWIVRNEGKEAEFTNDLGHFAGRNTEASEHSAYSGTHFMDLIIKSPVGFVIGFRRIPVNILGSFTAPRNKNKPWAGRPSKSQMGYAKFKQYLK